VGTEQPAEYNVRQKESGIVKGGKEVM